MWQIFHNNTFIYYYTNPVVPSINNPMWQLPDDIFKYLVIRKTETKTQNDYILVSISNACINDISISNY